MNIGTVSHRVHSAGTLSNSPSPVSPNVSTRVFPPRAPPAVNASHIVSKLARSASHGIR